MLYDVNLLRSAVTMVMCHQFAVNAVNNKTPESKLRGHVVATPFTADTRSLWFVSVTVHLSGQMDTSVNPVFTRLQVALNPDRMTHFLLTSNKSA